MNSLTVIVPTLRRFRPLLETLGDLLAQDHPAFDIMVADQNESWPAELTEDVKRIQQDPRVQWLHFETPGVVAARNECATRARGEILLFVDDDVRIPNRAFLGLHVRHYTRPDIDGVQGREFLREGREAAQRLEEIQALLETETPTLQECDFSQLPPWRQFFAPARHHSPRRAIAACFCTCNASVRKSAFEAIGGFDESFRGNSYGDDHDFAIRFAEAGRRILYDPEAWLLHLQAPIGGLRLSDQGNTFSNRERYLSYWLMYLRHSHKLGRWKNLYRGVLRKTVLSGGTLKSPRRMITAVPDLVIAYREAARAVRKGPTSRI